MNTVKSDTGTLDIDGTSEQYIPEYGDLADLNTDRTILDAVGKEVLHLIVSDFLDDLQSSSAVYERNGDYALGILSSAWCCTLDDISRKKCKTPDNKAAMECGEWLCHESCWTSVSKIAIQRKEPVDKVCNGGLHIYAVPIMIEDDCIGAINFGYGVPPEDRNGMNAIADRYGVPIDELMYLSKKVQRLSPETIVHAKKRLHTSALLISKIVHTKRIENKLRESENDLKKTQKIAHVGSWRLDLATSEVTWTEELYKMYGFDAAMPPPPYSEHMKLFTSASWKKLTDALEKTRTTEIPYELELETVKPDGSNGWMWVRGEVVKDPEGNTVGLWGAAQDITARKQVEYALEENSKKYRGLLENMDVGVVAHRADTSIITSNPRAIELLGLSEDQMKGKVAIDPQWRFIDKNSVTLPLQEYPVNRVLAGRKPIRNQFAGVVRPATNDIVWLVVNGFPVMNSAGELVEILINFIDVTEYTMMEKELLKVQKLDALGLLAGGIAHDFNNLMGGIFGYIDMARELAEEKNVTSYLSKAMDTIDRARALTRQLLTFAKGGAPVRQVGNLFPFVEETARFALSGANVSSHFDVPPDLWNCNYDKNQIGQVFDNLMINAQQAMPLGGMIELTARNCTIAENEHPVLNSGDYVKISIKDTGVGMPSELVLRIFDPFYTTKAKGHGLGLATCYSIIKRHDGCIDVESQPGKGTTFKVYLPASMESGFTGISTVAETHIGRGTFLVMDDEEVIRDTIGDMLAAFGYSVVRKENGRETIDFYTSELRAKRNIAGMMLDLTVPGAMGGKDTVKEIRKTDKGLPVFVASGYADDPVMKNPEEYGFTASVSKPFKKVELASVLNRYMNVKK